jgi:hypothetical protein
MVSAVFLGLLFLVVSIIAYGVWRIQKQWRLETHPHLVELESNPLSFLRHEEFSSDAGAKRHVGY